MPRTPTIWLWPLLLLCALRVGAEERFYAIESGAEENSVEFTSRARIESFSGSSRALSGWFAVDPDSLGTLRGELLLDLSDLDTGIGLRNNHMHEHVLHTDRYPTATLTPKSCEPGKLGPDESRLTLRAELNLHGQTRPIEIELRARREGDAIALAATFEVVLEDFGIARPRMLILKVAERVQIEVSALAHPSTPPQRSP